MIENKQKLSFPSNVDSMHIVEDFVEKICDEFQIHTTYFGNILIAVTEAVENAIKHGNKSNPDKKVTLFFEYDNQGIRFIIQDEGNGFDMNAIPDPTETNTTIGRGIYLIKALADDVKFDNNGSTIFIDFAIKDMNLSTAYHRINELQKFSQKSKKEDKTKTEPKPNNNIF